MDLRRPRLLLLGPARVSFFFDYCNRHDSYNSKLRLSECCESKLHLIITGAIVAATDGPEGNRVVRQREQLRLRVVGHESTVPGYVAAVRVINDVRIRRGAAHFLSWRRL